MAYQWWMPTAQPSPWKPAPTWQPGLPVPQSMPSPAPTPSQPAPTYAQPWWDRYTPSPAPAATPPQQAQQPAYPQQSYPQYPVFNFDTNPMVAAARAAYQEGLSGLDSYLKQAREQAIIRFGDPSLAGLAGFGLDPQAADYAKQSYLSGNATLARLERQKTNARQAIINRLAAHGMVGSGETGYQLGQEDITYGHQLYDSRNQVLDYLSQLLQSYLDRKNALQQSLAQAYQNAFSSYASQPIYYGVG